MLSGNRPGSQKEQDWEETEKRKLDVQSGAQARARGFPAACAPPAPPSPACRGAASAPSPQRLAAPFVSSVPALSACMLTHFQAAGVAALTGEDESGRRAPLLHCKRGFPHSPGVFSAPAFSLMVIMAEGVKEKYIRGEYSVVNGP